MPDHYNRPVDAFGRPKSFLNMTPSEMAARLTRRGAGNQQKRGRGGATAQPYRRPLDAQGRPKPVLNMSPSEMGQFITGRPSASSRQATANPPAAAATPPMQLVAPANPRQQQMQLSAPANSRPQTPMLPQPTVPPASPQATVSPAMRFGAVRPSPANQPAAALASPRRPVPRSSSISASDAAAIDSLAELARTNNELAAANRQAFDRIQQGYETMTGGNSSLYDSSAIGNRSRVMAPQRPGQMTTQEALDSAFNVRDSGIRGRGPYGGRPTYTQPGGMAGREAALAGSSLDYGAGTGPVEQPPRKSVDTGTVVGYDRAQQIAVSIGGEYGDFKPGETVNLGDGAVFTVAKDTKDPLRAIKGDSVLLGTQGRFGGPRRDGEVRQGPNGEYVPGGNLNTNEKFMAQRDRRAQRREDALATRRSMLPYRTRGIPMNAIFLDQEGMADPLMNAGMFQEASRRDQVNDQRSEMARQFDARMQQSGDQFDANLGLQTRQQQFAEDEALRRERENRRDDRRQRRQDRRTYRDGEELRGEQLRRQQLENDKLQAEVDRLTEDDPIADEARDREGRMLIGEQQDQANLYINMPIATDDQKVEYLDKVLNDRDMSIEDKKRAAQRAGVTSMDQLYRLIRSSGYAGVRQYGPFSAAGPADGTGIGIVFDRYEDPTTAELRESVIGGGKSIFGG